jgi:hypothetical protein
MAADADVQVDDERQLLGQRFGGLDCAHGFLREIGEHFAGAAEHAWGVRHRRHLREGFLGLFGRRRLDAHAHVVPAGLAGDRVGVADVPVAGQLLVIRWLSRKPLRDSSAPGASCQAPEALPMAFQVHTVPGSTASL